MGYRRVLIELDRATYARLAEVAKQEDREVHQQACYLLRQALHRLEREQSSDHCSGGGRP